MHLTPEDVRRLGGRMHQPILSAETELFATKRILRAIDLASKPGA
jgi:hypothetical protein